MSAWKVLPALLVLAACKSGSDEPTPAGPVASASAAAPSLKPEFVDAPPGQEVAAFVRSEEERAKRDHRKLVVYVGATWCEPCQRFHQALVAGSLDHELASVRFVDYDLDKSGELLAAAGYSSELIPLFCVPRSDGRAGEKRISGSIKGPGAVAEIMPRLAPLLR